MEATKDRFINTTRRLLETQGYHATGVNQIVEESGAPRGSLYYHFPGGKEQLAVDAVQRAGETTAALIEENFSDQLPVPDAVREFAQGVAEHVKASQYQSGSPLTAVAMETANTNPALNQACQEAFTRVQQAFSTKLQGGGIPKDRADQLASFITASLEGGIVLSRAYHSKEPLMQAAQELFHYLKGNDGA